MLSFARNFFQDLYSWLLGDCSKFSYDLNAWNIFPLEIAQIKNSKSKILRLAVHFCFLQCIYSGGHCSSWRGYRLYFRLCHSKFLFPWNHYWYAKLYTKIYDSFIEKCLLWLRHVLRMKITLLIKRSWRARALLNLSLTPLFVSF